MNSAAPQLLDDPVWAVTGYMDGYFPLYDLKNRFYWERLPERAVLRVNAETVERARAMKRRAGKRFVIEKNRRFEECIRHLQNPEIKEFSWVRAEVVRIYQTLGNAGLLLTLEAVNGRGELAGGLIGIVLPGVFVAETMFGLEADASKACLCALVEDLHARGFGLMDTQTRHDRDPWGRAFPKSRTAHPCVRLGEEVWRIERFMKAFGVVMREGGFASAAEWVRAAGTVAAAERAWREDPGVVAALRREMAKNPAVARAFGWLQINLPADFAMAVAG